MENMLLSSYNFTIRDFDFCGVPCRVVITPELYAGEGDLDFTGSFLGILISPETGTLRFELSPGLEGEKQWETDPENLNPLLIGEFAKIIKEIREKKINDIKAAFN